MVNSAGAVLATFGGPTGPGPTQFRDPYRLAVDRQERLYVVDGANNRVMAIESDLRAGTVGRVLVQSGLDRPYTVDFDQASSRLMVGNGGNSGVLLIFKID